MLGRALKISCVEAQRERRFYGSSRLIGIELSFRLGGQGAMCLLINVNKALHVPKRHEREIGVEDVITLHNIIKQEQYCKKINYKY